MITSGCVFVFDEIESRPNSWTDGFFWSPSRILGNFLLYRETDKRGAGHRSTRLDTDTNDEEFIAEGQLLSCPKTDNSTNTDVDKVDGKLDELQVQTRWSDEKGELTFSKDNSGQTMNLGFFFELLATSPSI